jgi:predicted DsbA family dithiol-disulfide isomerase
VVERLKQEYDVEVRWMPFELRPGLPKEGQALPEYIRASVKDPNNPLLKMAKAQGVPMVFKEMLFSSRLAHEATEFARTRGRQEEFHHAVFARYWGQDQDIASVEMLCQAATEVGLDAVEMKEALTARTYKAEVDALLRNGREMGVSGVPLYVINEEIGISGAQPYQAFVDCMKELGIKPKVMKA